MMHKVCMGCNNDMSFRADRSLIYNISMSYCNDLCLPGQTDPWSK